MSFSLHSAGFRNGGEIPRKYVPAGVSLSKELMAERKAESRRE